MCEKQLQETISIPDRRAEILTAVDVAQASIARGESRKITRKSMRQLADKVKQHGLARLSSEKSA